MRSMVEGLSETVGPSTGFQPIPLPMDGFGSPRDPKPCPGDRATRPSFGDGEDKIIL